MSHSHSPSVAETFDNLKKAFTYAPILVHANLEKPFIIKADALDFFSLKKHIISLVLKTISAAKYKIDGKEVTILPQTVLCKT